MKEAFLHYIWQYQLFDKKNLQTDEGLELVVIKQGYLNSESGPDFLQAQLKIDGLSWFGSVEIHVEAKDWERHQHQYDEAYDQVVLHVVWEKSFPARRKDGSLIPTLQLSGRVDHHLLLKHDRLLMNAHQKSFTCTSFLKDVPDIYKLSAIEKAAARRLDRKGREVLKIVQHHQLDWHQSALQLICKSFGFKSNADAFEKIGNRLSYRVLVKESASFVSILALLLQVSGLLETTKLQFHPSLKETCLHLSSKYGLKDKNLQLQEYKWAPLRPANMPYVRLIQLAAFLKEIPDLLAFLTIQNDPEKYFSILKRANRLLRHNTRLYGNVPAVGEESMRSILINAVAPFKYAFGIYHGEEQRLLEANELLEKLPPEMNRYVRLFRTNRFSLKNALETQGAIELYRFQCEHKQCLSCPVGGYIMNNHDLVVI